MDPAWSRSRHERTARQFDYAPPSRRGQDEPADGLDLVPHEGRPLMTPGVSPMDHALASTGSRKSPGRTHSRFAPESASWGNSITTVFDRGSTRAMPTVM